MDPTPPIPVACALSPEALRARSAQLLPGLMTMAIGRERIPDGLRLQFPASSEVLHAIASTIDAERQCCRFLRFDLTVAPDGGPVWLTLSGPANTAELLEALLQQ